MTMYKLSRNMQICSGESCGECLQIVPALVGGGLLISLHNLDKYEEKIDEIIRLCPVGALELNPYDKK